jgi:DNA (cytosine-5)-methyltransferase 1
MPDPEKTSKSLPSSTGVYVDLFSGCGGMSLGLRNAGWTLAFAIEKNLDAFNTYKTNLIRPNDKTVWPEWLPQKAQTTRTVLSKFAQQLAAMRGQIDLIAGGPPCQGFSLAGRRIHSDPRNSLFKDYLTFVSLINPRFLLVENVQGFDMPFRSSKKHGSPITYSQVLKQELAQLNYIVFSDTVDLVRFGVPQNRKRFIVLAVRKDEAALLNLKQESLFERLYAEAPDFLKSKGLVTGIPVTTNQAIGDLKTAGKRLVDWKGPMKGFKQLDYSVPKDLSPFLALMRKDCGEAALSSLRLPRHKKETILQFSRIRSTCKAGYSLCDEDRKRLGIKKHALTPLAPDLPSATITTLPDDLIHYSEPRVLTVREHARLQTFPDWFVFTGKYTTGGKSRRNDCPRYSQVGNAVPPLFAEALGSFLGTLGSRSI